MHEAEIELAADPSSVAAARRLVSDALDVAGASDDEWTARQVVSELATNAVMHAGTPFLVKVMVDDAVVRIEVVDRKPLAPAMKRRFSNEATTGRGLRLVDMLGQAWGVESSASTKTVWCELRRAAVGDDGEDVAADRILAALMEDDDPDAAGDVGSGTARVHTPGSRRNRAVPSTRRSGSPTAAEAA